ncbi:MAG: hypothetical protein IT288_08590, partial [Bdellovibrionales bacterium]|nr:hypothetical protein [Bdellovibrionales bacterium]
PVFVYGLQKGLGLWPQGDPGAYKNYHLWVKGSWFFMEIATIIGSAIALRIYQFSFLTFPLALSLWYMSMDLTPLLFGKDDFTFDERKVVSCIFGLLMLAIAYTLDLRNKKIDFAFWTYLYGMLAFWGGLTMMNSDSELSKFLYCLINVGFVVLSVYLRRKVFIVFGTFGILGYIGHLAWEIFKDSFAFPIALALLGIFILFLGVKYQKNRARFESAVERHLPSFLMKWRPPERT